ncbi:MAG: sulfurtransferase TusA family protein [Bacillota bacterium]
MFIEPLPANTEVTFYLDQGAPIENVPSSLKNEGHEIISKKQHVDGYYILKVKKKGE